MTKSKPPVLEVSDLTVDFEVDGTWVRAVDGLSYELGEREVLAIVGESGSGKTQSSMALLGLLPRNGRATGSVRLDGRELLGLRNKELSAIRGKAVGVVFQEPMTAMNPVYTISYQISEVLRRHMGMDKARAHRRVVELLELVEMPEPEASADKYPHQMSGGQLQRAVIAQAIACEPRVLVADEPTTALDVTVQATILDLLRDLRDRIDSSIVLITHDLGVVADLADRVLVMRNGVLVESGNAEDIFNRPTAAYTQDLLAAVPILTTVATEPHEDEQVVDSPIVAARDLEITYGAGRGAARFVAVDGVTFSIDRGEILGLVGESGSGKSTIGQAMVGLVPVSGGSLAIDGVELNGVSARALRELRRRVAVVFQDPGSSLDPRMLVGDSIAEPLWLNKLAEGDELERRVEELLDQVHLPRSMRTRFPHELSGGQRQRIGIARAMALRPAVLIADEPTSALDVSVQDKVLDLFEELQDEHGFACLFISHDLAVVERLSDRIAVLNRGRLAEEGPTGQILHAPADPYTQRLLAAVPVPHPEQQAVRREERLRLANAE